MTLSVLAMGLCVSMIAYIRLPSLKVSTLLLFGLLIYDVFWVSVVVVKIIINNTSLKRDFNFLTNTIICLGTVSIYIYVVGDCLKCSAIGQELTDEKPIIGFDSNNIIMVDFTIPHFTIGLLMMISYWFVYFSVTYSRLSKLQIVIF